MLIFTSIHCSPHTQTLHQCMIFYISSIIPSFHTSPATYSPNIHDIHISQTNTTYSSYTFMLFTFIYMMYTTNVWCTQCRTFINALCRVVYDVLITMCNMLQERSVEKETPEFLELRKSAEKQQGWTTCSNVYEKWRWAWCSVCMHFVVIEQ